MIGTASRRLALAAVIAGSVAFGSLPRLRAQAAASIDPALLSVRISKFGKPRSSVVGTLAAAA